jgi:hypothetical protein
MKVATLLFAAFAAVIMSAPAPKPEVDIKRGLRLAKLIKRAGIEKRLTAVTRLGALGVPAGY